MIDSPNDLYARRREEKQAWMRGKQAQKEYRDGLEKIEAPKPPLVQPYGVRHPNSIIVWLVHEFWPSLQKGERQ